MHIPTVRDSYEAYVHGPTPELEAITVLRIPSVQALCYNVHDP